MLWSYIALYLGNTAVGEQYEQHSYVLLGCIVDWEIFTLKKVYVKIFIVLNFCSLFDPWNFMVDGYNIDEHLESS